MDIDHDRDERRLKEMYEDVGARTPRSEREATLLGEMDEHNQQLADSAWYAVSLVLRAAGARFDWSTELRMTREQAKSLWHRSHLTRPLAAESDCYFDDGGRLVLSGQTALRLASALAAAEPVTVTTFVAQQRTLGSNAVPGNVDQDQDKRAFATVIRWTKQQDRLETTTLRNNTASRPGEQ